MEARIGIKIIFAMGYGEFQEVINILNKNGIF